MRTGSSAAVLAVAVAAVAACGPSREERMASAAAAAAEPQVLALLADLDAGRYDAARARGTAELQAAASSAAIRAVAEPMRAVLGAPQARALVGTSDLIVAPGADEASGATLQYRTRFAKGDADLRVRVRRGADAAWRVDGFVASTPALTFTLRP